MARRLRPQAERGRNTKGIEAQSKLYRVGRWCAPRERLRIRRGTVAAQRGTEAGRFRPVQHACGSRVERTRNRTCEGFGTR